MSPCTDPTVGRLLAEYELGLLGAESRDAFELHALSCDDCFRELDRLAEVTASLRTSDAAWEAVREAAALPEASPWYAALCRWLWPSGGPWLKPAVGLALVLLILPLAWRGWLRPDDGQPSALRPVQEFPLTSLRGTSGTARVTPTPGVDLVLVFGIEFGSPTRAIEVALVGPAGDTLYRSEQFALDARLQGRLNLGSQSHATGLHTLILRDPGAPAPFQSDTLRFEIASPPNQTR